MSDSTSAAITLELVTKTMNRLAQEIGMMDSDGPRRDSCLEEYFRLSRLRRSLKAKIDLVGEHMDELAREMTTLKPGDSLRPQIVQEIMRLCDLLRQT